MSNLSADRQLMSVLGAILANQAAIMAALSHLDVPVNTRSQLAVLNEKTLKLVREGMSLERSTHIGTAAARREVHANRMKRWPSRWRSLFLRLALGFDTFDYMLRSIKNDPRTPGARLVDIVVRQDAREKRTEADWIKTIARMVYHIEPWQHGRKHWNVRRLWCWLDDHGGIAWDPDMPATNAARPYCKRCGARVRLIA